MAKNIFPSENSIGTLLGADTRQARERQMVLWQKQRAVSPLERFVYSGYAISAGAGLSVSVAAGVALLDGYRVENTAAETLSGLTASRAIAMPNFIWLQLDFDGDDLVTDYTLVANTTGTPPINSLLLGVAATDGSAVISVLSSYSSPRVVGGSYTGDDEDDRIFFLGFKPKRVTVWGIYKTVLGVDFGAIANSIPEDGDLGWNSEAGTITGVGAATDDDLDIPFLTPFAGYGFLVHQDDGTDQGLNRISEPYNWVAEA